MNPSFVFAGPNGAILADGIRTGFSDLADTQAALRSGTPIVVGALPFDPTAPAALPPGVTLQQPIAPPPAATPPLPTTAPRGAGCPARDTG